MEPEEFIESIGNEVGKICADYNLPASVCIAQAAIESGWGRYCIGGYNYFGRKWGGEGNYIEKPTYEFANGEYIQISDKFQDYDSLEDAIRDWCILMTEEPAYSEALSVWNNTWDIRQFVEAMAPVYATDPDYAGKIMATISANDLMRFDGWNDVEEGQ